MNSCMGELRARVIAPAALAHPQRLRAFRALVLAGPAGMAPSVLAEQLGVARMPSPYTSTSYRVRAGSTASNRGRYLIYRVNYDRMNGLLSYLTEHCCPGGVCEISTATPAKPVDDWRSL